MKFIIYMISVVTFTLWQIYRFLVTNLQLIGQSAEWYAERKLMPWQARRAREIYNAEHAKKLQKQIDKINGVKK